MINCENCRRYKKSCTGGLEKEQCEKIKLPQTNADRIRQMTDEELASYLTGVWYSFEEPPGMCDVCDKNSVQNCSECWLDWLKSPVEVDE